MGQIHVYTGDGKGKTTAAFGLAVRALGRNKKIAVIRFLKSQDSGEVLALSQHKNVTIKSFGTKRLIDPHKITDQDRNEAKKALLETKRSVKQNFNLIILDEINIALAFGLIDINEVIKIIKNKSNKTDLILTGRRAHLKIIEIADTVTEMRKIKHAFDKGKKAKAGIEY